MSNGGLSKYRCQYFLTKNCGVWVFVNNTACAMCCAKGYPFEAEEAARAVSLEAEVRKINAEYAKWAEYQERVAAEREEREEAERRRLREWEEILANCKHLLIRPWERRGRSPSIAAISPTTKRVEGKEPTRKGKTCRTTTFKKSAATKKNAITKKNAVTKNAVAKKNAVTKKNAVAKRNAVTKKNAVTTSKWSLEADALLLRLRVQEHGWEEIAPYFPDKTAFSCRYHYSKKVMPHVKNNTSYLCTMLEFWKSTIDTRLE
ncbi:hypothetical protein OQA88_11990 [Cercophora sp. LCS_1]